mmetsp:Transcript_23122/g.64295  ORF Transcript_23122/g.64295 Transcript_23122/m.64295 type:complete len:102 (+) Transcript_23122:827-1132(+)
MEMDVKTTGIKSLGVMYPGSGPDSWATTFWASSGQLGSCSVVVVPPRLAKGLFKRGPSGRQSKKPDASLGDNGTNPCPENPIVPCDPNIAEPGQNRKKRRF